MNRKFKLARTVIEDERRRTAFAWEAAIEGAERDQNEVRRAWCVDVAEACDTHYGLALHRLAAGDVDGAREDLERAAVSEALGGDNQCARRALAALAAAVSA